MEAVRAAVQGAVSGFPLPWDERKDAAQEALGRIVGALRSGRFREGSALTSFAFGVARFVCLEKLRRAGSAEPLEANAPARPVGPEEWLLRKEHHRQSIAALSRLSRTSREILYLIFVERLSYREAGRLLGLTEGAVKSRVHRWRRGLRPDP